MNTENLNKINIIDQSLISERSITETLNEPNKIRNLLNKYISKDLKNISWEKEGKDVNYS